MCLVESRGASPAEFMAGCRSDHGIIPDSRGGLSCGSDKKRILLSSALNAIHCDRVIAADRLPGLDRMKPDDLMPRLPRLRNLTAIVGFLRISCDDPMVVIEGRASLLRQPLLRSPQLQSQYSIVFRLSLAIAGALASDERPADSFPLRGQRSNRG